ncbi:hemolysin III family protein [Brevibacterium sp. UMB10442]|uniref:PAQR family membrane homeostasis protein TrhA n=1 Tax=Brevibacterium sp. UMB1308A TaxID=3050608 RepID=UPI00254C158D|nr:hemolysin III family protein [Brevibacterium sp. UMB1308A]MDK7748858.1 hemolysin III family protein [Brevibacterium sp. UMB10442]MDK8345773.1 hemolysin III family protein [Brevibacterium sp. UMB1308B]MDK8712769.1 hemolysin III family protein [Brevibacterium sp. UMB1308A]
MGAHDTLDPVSDRNRDKKRDRKLAAAKSQHARRLRNLRVDITRFMEIRPSWRGWIHAGAFPLAVAGGLAAVILCPTIASRLASAIFAITGMMLFGTSAMYHRGSWRVRVRILLRRLDHANIFLITAGTYTPLAVLLLDPPASWWLLGIIWTGAILGVIFRLIWISAPRWLFVPVYIGIGIAGIGFIPSMWMHNLAAGILIVIGGASYITGAVIYALKRPNPFPAQFGFHEIFHTATVIGYGCHLAAILVSAVAAL